MVLDLLDSDECATANGGCEDRCENIPGSYNCYCDADGYDLADDGHTCDRKSSSNNLQDTPLYNSNLNNSFLGVAYFMHCGLRG